MHLLFIAGKKKKGEALTASVPEGTGRQPIVTERMETKSYQCNHFAYHLAVGQPTHLHTLSLPLSLSAMLPIEASVGINLVDQGAMRAEFPSPTSLVQARILYVGC